MKISATFSICVGLFLTLISYVEQANAQYVPGVNNNLTLQSNLHEHARYSNLWGYVDSSGNEYALLGTDAGLSIIDVTTPASPVEITLIPGPTNVPGATIWREVKTRGTYAYVVSEHMVPNNLSGLQIIDLSGLPGSATLVRNYRWPNVDSTNARAHTVTIDDAGYLYIQGGTATLGTGGHQGGIRIFSLDDPENPNPLGLFNPRYVHDVFIRNDVLFSSNIFDGGHIDILDVSDRSNPQLIVSHVYPNGFSHNTFATEDDQYLFSTDEVTGLTMKVFDIGVIWDADTTNDDQITQVAEYTGDPNQIAHEIFIRGDYGFLSHYVEGVKILDISDPTNPVEVAYYDTYPQAGSGFNGDWGVYPFLPSGNVLVSDIQTGLYVLQFDSVSAGAVTGVITDSQSGLPVSDVTISFVEASKTVTTDGSGVYRLDSNEGLHTLVLSKVGYFADTVSVNILSDSVSTEDFAILPNLADIDVSVSDLVFALVADTVFQTEFVISNSGGPGSLLEYSVDDVLGTLAPLANKPGKSNDRGRSVLTGLNVEGLDKTPARTVNSNLVGDTIIVDPAGDLLFGSGGDVIGMYASVTPTDVTIELEFATAPSVDSTYALISVDTDFDPMTGANPGGFGFNDPGQDIGSEFDFLVNLPELVAAGIPANTVSVWPGSNQQPQSNPVYAAGVTIAGNVVFFTIPLSAISDDGNMAIAGSAGHLDAALGATSQDLLPDVGHGIIGQNPAGDLPWLELSVSGGSLGPAEADTVLVTVNTGGLQPGSNHTGSIVIVSNDISEPSVTIPVSLDVITSIDVDVVTPIRFNLGQNYPNPFNPTTAIRYEVASPGRVVVKIFNVMGQEIRTLVDAAKQAGTYTATWDGNDRYGKRAASGVYFYTMKSVGYFKSRKMLLLK